MAGIELNAEDSEPYILSFIFFFLGLPPSARGSENLYV